MAETNTSITVMDQPVENIGVGSWQSGLAAAVNDTYTFASNNYFYAILPNFYRSWGWKYCRVACQWLDGYVPSLHQSGISGIISTRIATKLITGLTKQIVGEKIIFKPADKKDQKSLETLKFVYNWGKAQRIKKAIFSGIGYALGVGTSLIKINVKNHKEIWWQAFRMDSCHYLASFNNEIEEATFVVKNYIDTREDKETQFFLVEHRFYEISKGKISEDGKVLERKGDKIPMVEYKVHRVVGSQLNDCLNAKGNVRGINWDEIPEEIRRIIKKDYSVIRVNEPQRLPLPNIGVGALLNGEQELGIPTATNFGEGMIVGIQDDLITYELASSYQIRDMYNGKGKVYLPKSLSVGDFGDSNAVLPLGPDGRVIANGQEVALAAPGGPGLSLAASPLNQMKDDAVELLKGVSPDEQKAIVQQFELRAQEWQLIKENCLRNIAVKWGMSPKILSSFLAVGSAQMTATQVDSEDDMSIAFIYHTRSYFKDTLNELLETTLNFYGYTSNVELDFASPSLINKDRILRRVEEKLKAGLIDLDDAIREMNPDLDEEAIQDKVARAIKRQQEMQLQAMNEFNQAGGFGNEQLGGDDLDGSTNPIQ